MKEAFINAMCAAIEGGSEYWCEEIGFYDVKGKHMTMEDWFDTGSSIKVYDGECSTSVNKEVFFSRATKLFQNWQEVFGGEEDYDAADADQFLQLGIFEDVIYG